MAITSQIKSFLGNDWQNWVKKWVNSVMDNDIPKINHKNYKSPRNKKV